VLNSLPEDKMEVGLILIGVGITLRLAVYLVRYIIKQKDGFQIDGKTAH
jgi:hypothetical protein